MTLYHTPGGIQVAIATLSRIGSRRQNEDACGYWVADAGYCFVVSDGAGGHVGGAVASEIAVKAVLTDFAASPAFSKEAVSRAISIAESQIHQGRDGNRELRDMTATIAVLMLDPHARQALYGHLGDTRIYSFQRGRARQLTRDHSLVQNLVDAGYVAAGDLRTHPDRSVLLAALGIEGEVIASTAERPLGVQEGDAFLICSDGLWEGMNEAEMEAALIKAGSVEEWLSAMAAYVEQIAKPSQDNYTAIGIWIGAPGEITIVPGNHSKA